MSLSVSTVRQELLSELGALLALLEAYNAAPLELQQDCFHTRSLSVSKVLYLDRKCAGSRGKQRRLDGQVRSPAITVPGANRVLPMVRTMPKQPEHFI